MDRIWQWAWDRHGARYSWAICAIAFPCSARLPRFVVCRCRFRGVRSLRRGGRRHRCRRAGAGYLVVLPGLAEVRLAEQWAAGHEVDRATALEATYTYARGAVARGVVGSAVSTALLSVVVGAIAGASGSRLVQYGILGAVIGTAILLIAVHSFVEAALRPARVAIAGDTGIGDSLPRSRPTFAAWSNVSMLAVAFAFAVSGAMLAAVFDRASEVPVLVGRDRVCIDAWLRGADHCWHRVLAVAATHSRPRRRD